MGNKFCLGNVCPTDPKQDDGRALKSVSSLLPSLSVPQVSSSNLMDAADWNDPEGIALMASWISGLNESMRALGSEQWRSSQRFILF